MMAKNIEAEKIGQFIKNIRKENKLTQKELENKQTEI